MISDPQAWLTGALQLFPGMECWQLVLSVFIIVLAGALQGSTGFGFNLLAAPTVAVLMPQFVPGPMLLLSLIVSLGGAIGERKYVHFAGATTALLGRALASVGAVFFLGLLDPGLFAAFFGGLVLLAVGLSVSGLKLDPTPCVLFCAGFVSGFMGTLTSIGAPPMALAMQSASGTVMRSTLNSFFVLGTLISITVLASSGHFPANDVLIGAAMAPFALFGLFLSRWTGSYLDAGWMRPAVLLVSALSGVALIARSFL